MRTTAQIDADMTKLRATVATSKEKLRKLARERDEAAAKEEAERPRTNNVQEIGGAAPKKKARRR